MKRFVINIVSAMTLAAAVATGISALPAQAQTGAPPVATSPWAASHPARAEVNGRLANQQGRITAERQSGQIGPRQAQRMRAHDRAIRQDERRMARRDHNGGHLTRHQIAKLNHKLNVNSQRIR